MDYWHSIVNSYDDPQSKDPKKKDDGTYSQFPVVILLIYLSFGPDYSYNIARHFFELQNPELRKKRSSVLRHTGRVGTVLNKMEEDGLVISEAIGSRKYFSINPRIIQSPRKDAPHVKSDGSTFEIPLGEIEQFLAWQKENARKFDARDLFFKTVLFSDAVDYITFMIFLEKEASFQESMNSRWPFNSGRYIHILQPNFDLVADSLDYHHNWLKKVTEENMLKLGYSGKIFRFLSGQISEYIDELEELSNSPLELDREHKLDFTQVMPKQSKRKEIK